MKTLNFVLSLGIALTLPTMFAAEPERSSTATAKEIAFIKKAADGGMAEVELGKLAVQNGQRDDVKEFGHQMIADHGKANENLKSVASKLMVTVPEKVSEKHQGVIDKMSKMLDTAFDTRYIEDMVADHEKDIAEFENARDEVTSEDLKKFIDETIPVMKEHLEMAKKMKATK